MSPWPYEVADRQECGLGLSCPTAVGCCGQQMVLGVRLATDFSPERMSITTSHLNPTLVKEVGRPWFFTGSAREAS